MASPLIIAALAGALSGLSVPAQLDGHVTYVAADCSAAASRVVAQTGGQLLSAKPSGGNCVVTVLVPGNGNERPRKVTVKVPQ
ncbi:hypothetical protein ACQQ2Q_02055 [Agrobacterium sp. ES01]|uniref:hypothetical protein n=1 Tax=Agrobacterium sp. ES01 TaxID=3420714 RepID=UPI003D10CF39